MEVRVVKGVHPLLNAEAIRVIRAMGEQERWVAGRVKGSPVATLFLFPIAFKL